MNLMPGLDSDAIRHAILTAQARGYRQVRVRLGEDRFSAVLADAPQHEPEADDEAPLAEAAVVMASEQSVDSPAVGYFRAVADLVVGSRVAEGDKVGEVVALGLANDVTAKASGAVAEMLVEDGAAVEYGQKILVLRP